MLHHELQAARIKRFIAISGPEYVDVSLVVIRHEDDYTIVDWLDGDEPDAIFRRQVSYASWFMLRNTLEGDSATVKIRSDDAGLKL